MGKPSYRVLVAFDPQRAMFTARAPELEHLSGDGPTRRDAVARLEEEIDAQLANMLSTGSTPPRAVDEEEFSGEVQAKVSRGLHRELVYLARSEGVELDQILSELLAQALSQRQSGRSGGRASRSPNHHAEGTAHADDIGNRADSHRGGGHADGNRVDGPRRGFGRGGYSPQILDDRANFIEYVRNQEQQPGGRGGQGRGGHGGGQHAGGAHGGGSNQDNNRRRRRGGGGQPQGREGQRPQGQGGRGPGGPGPAQGGGHGQPAARGAAPAARPSQPVEAAASRPADSGE